MSDTPRTDAIELAIRELERELNEARALHANAIDLLNKETRKLAEAQAEIARFRGMQKDGMV